MKHKSRVNKLWSRLSTRERAISVLQSLKAGEGEDPMLRHKMPWEQIGEFNRYIRLLQGVNLGLGLLVMRYPPIVETIRLRLAVLVLTELSILRADASFGYVALHCREPLDEAAEILADEHEGWEPEELEEGMPTDAAKERVFAKKRRELEELVKKGELEGEEADDALLINVGSFYGWKGEPLPVIPRWGMEYDIRPDDEAEAVEERRNRMRRVWEFRRQMWRLWGDTPGDERSEDLAERIRDDIEVLWQEVEALRSVLGEFAEDFYGEDPALPELPEIVDDTGSQLQRLRPLAEVYAGPFELPEPSGELVDELREAMESL